HLVHTFRPWDNQDRQSTEGDPMAGATADRDQTVADLLERLGGIPASRVRLVPTPGTATEQDVIDVHDRTNRLCELVDGVLVEKVMGFDESRFAAWIVFFLANYL